MMQNCTEDQMKDYYSFTGFTIMCPKPDEGLGEVDYLMLQGHQEANKSKSIIFQAKKCNNETHKENETKCASPEEIDDYIKDVVIGTWTQEKQIDYSKHA